MAEFSVAQKKSQDGITLTVAGSMTIEYAADMRDVLQDAFTQGDTVTVDLTKLEGIDISGLQLLCAAHRTSLAQEKRLIVQGSKHANVQKSAMLAGYYRHVGCSQDVTKTCIWVGGE
jgi:anti-anti-sigma factor